MEDQYKYLENVTIEFDEYMVKQARLFQTFKDDVEKKWGEFKFSSNKIYVDYDEDLNARGKYDYRIGLHCLHQRTSESY